jgi:hypothetical protein
MVIEPRMLYFGDLVRVEPDPPELVVPDVGRRRLDAEAQRGRDLT